MKTTIHKTEIYWLNVEVSILNNAVIDQNGRKLYEITVNGDEFDNIRSYDDESAIKQAIKSVEYNYAWQYSNNKK